MHILNSQHHLSFSLSKYMSKNLIIYAYLRLFISLYQVIDILSIPYFWPRAKLNDFYRSNFHL